MLHRHAISDADWDRIQDLLPGRPGQTGWLATDNRLFIDPFDRQASNVVLLGWTRNIAYQTRFSIQGGPRYSTYEGLRPELNAGLTRATNRLRLAFDYWHGETIILGIRGPVAIDNGTARFVVSMSPRTELGTHFGVSDSTTLDGENARVYRATLVGAWTPRGGPYTIAASYAADSSRASSGARCRCRSCPTTDPAPHRSRDADDRAAVEPFIPADGRGAHG